MVTVYISVRALLWLLHMEKTQVPQQLYTPIPILIPRCDVRVTKVGLLFLHSFNERDIVGITY